MIDWYRRGLRIAGLLQSQSVAALPLLLTAAALVVGALAVILLTLRHRRQSRKSETELRYREIMFDTLSTNVDDIFIMLDGATWRVDYLSPNIERLLGIPHGDAVNNIRLLSQGEKERVSREELEAIPVHDCRWWDRGHYHQVTGERRWFRETVYRESVQGVEKVIFVLSDRTRERQMTQNLQKALDAAKSANRAKSHFLSNMSHDIRTPMNAIIGFTVLLAKDAESPEKVREYTRKISASSQHLLSLINDVLDMSKIESGKTSLNVAEFSLPELMEELHTILLPQTRVKDQRFEFQVRGRPAEHLLGDKLHLNQILINLLSNAIKYTPKGGQISLLVEELEASTPQHARLRFAVRDNGVGMSEEFLQTVFDPFSREEGSTAGIQGTGLGMAITKNLVDLMNGTIRAESAPGEGSVFTVELSFAVPAPVDEGGFWARHGIGRILVADDEEQVCLDIREMMDGTGVEVSYVTDGAAAVEEVIRAQERGAGFHAILLDWKMPGQSGVATARQLRERVGWSVPILVLTAYDWSDIEDEARAAGIDAFMPKPFFVSTFRQVLDSLDAGAAEDAGGPLEDALRGLFFLVAEDNELNAEILSEMLDMEGAGCEVAPNGKEAVARFLRAPEKYDMILMDVQMPVMDGYEATRQIRASGLAQAAAIPIVAMTANAFAEDVRNALEAGMDGHLSKPIDMDAMRALLGRLRCGEADGSRTQ